MLHNVPWFELVGRATETGSLRRSGSGDMEEKHCSEQHSFTIQALESERKRGKNERGGLLERAAEQSMCF